MYAQLVGKFSTARGFIHSQGWTDIQWTDNENKASRFAEGEAKELAQKFEDNLPGFQYFAERDSSGVSNQAPYGLDNWVIRKRS
jgi:hypothetical protein